MKTGWQDFLLRNLKKIYPHSKFFHHVCKEAQLDDPMGSLAGGLAILTKEAFPFEVIEHYQPKTKGSFFPALLFKVKLPFGDKCFVDIINVHLRPPITDQHRPSITSYFSTSSIRKEEIQELLTRLSAYNNSSDLRIVAGDFNEGSYGSGFTWLEKKAKFKDAVYELASDTTTWYWPVFYGFSIYGSYDHIFYSTETLKALECTVMTEYKGVSDHLPVVAKIKVLKKFN